MPIPNRRPSMTDALQSLIEFSVPISSILDVGVLDDTRPLREKFSHLEHWLFEPVSGHAHCIANNYSNIVYRLFQVALSDQDCESYLVHLSNNAGTNITHSQLVADPLPWKDNPKVREIKRVKTCRLDTILQYDAPNQPYLLKLDVDGIELKVLRGANQTLRHCSVVIVEATLQNLHERVGFLNDCGFKLFDIVDQSYYAGVMWQVDLVFIALELFTQNPRLCPMENNEYFDPSLWHSAQ